MDYTAGPIAGGTQVSVDLSSQLQVAGISARRLEVSQVRPGLHEQAEGITLWPVYRISWMKSPVRLLGLWRLPGSDRGSGKFVRVPIWKTRMPPEAHRRYEAVNGIPQAEEAAVFLSTQLKDSHNDAILAVRIAEEWLELYRWRAPWRELGLSRLDICSA
jgi:hypothetical protein